MSECPTCHDTKYITITCSNCMGKGFIIDFDTPLDEDVDELMTCPHCDGQGEVMEECPDCTKSNEKGEE